MSQGPLTNGVHIPGSLEADLKSEEREREGINFGNHNDYLTVDIITDLNTSTSIYPPLIK